MATESLLSFAQSGINHVHRFFPAASLISVHATSREGAPILNPQLLTHVTLKFLSDPLQPSRDQLLSISSLTWGVWGEIDILGRATYSQTPFRIYDARQPDMIDVYEAHRILLAAGHEFYYNKVHLERQPFEETGEEFWWFTSLADPIRVGVGARSGKVIVTGLDSSISRSHQHHFHHHHHRRGEITDGEEIEAEFVAQERATLRNINEAIKIVHARFPAARLLAIKALGKQFAPVTEAIKYHLLFQYGRGHVDIFSTEIFGQWEVPIYTEGRVTGWHSVPYEATGRDFVVRAKF